MSFLIDTMTELANLEMVLPDADCALGNNRQSGQRTRTLRTLHFACPRTSNPRG